MRRTGRFFFIAGAFALASFQFASAAPILDTGREQFDPEIDTGRVETGFGDLGGFVANPRSAGSARPDGSGTALMKYEGYAADAMNGDAMKFLADFNLLTDRTAPRSYRPSSLDYLIGISSRKNNLRFQFDREQSESLFGGGGGWTNWDARGSLLVDSNGPQSTGPGQPLPNPYASQKSASFSGALTAGYYLDPGSTPSRMDGTGQAEWRYEAAGKLGLMSSKLLLLADVWALTDRNERRHLPSDLDTDLGVGTKLDGMELMIHRRTRQEIGAPGYALYYLLDARVPFDSRSILGQ